MHHIMNLERDAHGRLKRSSAIEYRCLMCGSTKTYVNPNDPLKRERWSRYENGVLCSRCYTNHIRNPREQPKYAKRKITFKGKRLALSFEPRIGVCNLCRAVVPFDTDRTHIHHEKYDDDDVLKYTMEVCTHCHSCLTFELGQMKAFIAAGKRWDGIIRRRDEKGKFLPDEKLVCPTPTSKLTTVTPATN